MLVCEIPRSFERSSPSKFRTEGPFTHINSGKIFEHDLLSSDSVAKSATQNLGFSEIDALSVNGVFDVISKVFPLRLCGLCSFGDLY